MAELVERRPAADLPHVVRGGGAEGGGGQGGEEEGAVVDLAW